MGKEELDIPLNAHYFFDLNGSSLDYFSLLTLIQTEFGISISQEEQGLYTIAQFCEYIQKNI